MTKEHEIGLLLTDIYKSLKKCEDAIQVELRKTENNLVEWLKITDEKVIAKVLEICSNDQTFELLVKEVGVIKAKKVIKYLCYELQKDYYNRYLR